MLRFMAWLCLNDNALSGSQMCVVTGPRIDLAIAMIDRMKKLFAGSSSKGLATFDTKVSLFKPSYCLFFAIGYNLSSFCSFGRYGSRP
jgi:hypothetical protein